MPYTINGGEPIIGNEWTAESTDYMSPNARAGIPGPGEWIGPLPDGEGAARRIIQEHQV